MTDTQHFDRLDIRGFRGFTDLRLEDCGKFNVFLGANDVGKTSILEAIFLLSGSVNPELALRVQHFRHLDVREHDDLSSLFHGLDFQKTIDLTAFSGGVSRRLEISAGWSETTIDAQTLRPGEDVGGILRLRGNALPNGQSSMSLPSGFQALLLKTSIETADGVTDSYTSTAKAQGGDVRFQMPTGAATESMISVRFFKTGHQYDSDPIGEMIVDKKSNRLIEYLQAVNPRIADIAVSGNIAYLDVGLKRMLPLNLFGGGMIRAAVILASCIRGDQRIVLIDEIENGLHYRAIASLLRALLTLSREARIQFFVTTHSVEFLRYLQRVLAEQPFAEYRDDVNCYALQRDKDSRVRAYRYTYEQFDHCVEHGLEIR